MVLFSVQSAKNNRKPNEIISTRYNRDLHIVQNVLMEHVICLQIGGKHKWYCYRRGVAKSQFHVLAGILTNKQFISFESAKGKKVKVDWPPLKSLDCHFRLGKYWSRIHFASVRNASFFKPTKYLRLIDDEIKIFYSLNDTLLVDTLKDANLRKTVRPTQNKCRKCSFLGTWLSKNIQALERRMNLFFPLIL